MVFPSIGFNSPFLRVSELNTFMRVLYQKQPGDSRQSPSKGSEGQILMVGLKWWG